MASCKSMGKAAFGLLPTEAILSMKRAASNAKSGAQVGCWGPKQGWRHWGRRAAKNL